MGSSRRNRVLAAALILLPSQIAAQQRRGPVVLAGHLARVGAHDTTVVPGATVVAHRVGPLHQGPIDSMRTDAGGAFRFRVAAPESGAVFVVSTMYQGIGYFSEPETASATGMMLAVFDTSSAGPPLQLALRNLVVTGAGGGGRRVLDVCEVQNTGTTTRVGSDTLAPSWAVRLPEGVVDVQPGAGDIPASAIHAEAGRLLVTAPFPPGDKQVVASYDVPGGQDRLRLVIDQPTATLDLLLDDSTAQPDGALKPLDPVTIEGHRFRHYSADSLAAGTAVTVRFNAARGSGGSLLAVIAAVVLLGAGAAVALTRRRPAAAAAAGAQPVGTASLASESRERLVAQIVALDERFHGQERDTPPAAWAAYTERRAALKAELARRLARSG